MGEVKKVELISGGGRSGAVSSHRFEIQVYNTGSQTSCGDLVGAKDCSEWVRWTVSLEDLHRASARCGGIIEETYILGRLIFARVLRPDLLVGMKKICSDTGFCREVLSRLWLGAPYALCEVEPYYEFRYEHCHLYELSRYYVQLEHLEKKWFRERRGLSEQDCELNFWVEGMYPLPFGGMTEWWVGWAFRLYGLIDYCLGLVGVVWMTFLIGFFCYWGYLCVASGGSNGLLWVQEWVLVWVVLLAVTESIFCLMHRWIQRRYAYVAGGLASGRFRPDGV